LLTGSNAAGGVMILSKKYTLTDISVENIGSID
jgi:hypothetical protein